jgi:protein-disulfide isomerase
MNTMRLIRIAVATLAAVLSIAAIDPHPDWTGHVTVSPTGSHVLGNPAAKVKLAEYVSYTCPHCAHFNEASEGPLKVAYVAEGKVSVEVRHLVRDPIDLAAALLANCGDQSGFFARHDALMRSQEQWLDKVFKASPAQRQAWSTGPVPQRLRGIAATAGFYELMARYEYSRPAVDRCLADEAMTQRLMGQTKAAIADGVQGTPSFAINGKLEDSVHDWDGLRALLDGKL